MLLYCIILSSSGKSNAVLKRQQEEFLASLPGSLRKSQPYQVPITIPISRITLFASRFPLPHFTLAILFALSFSFAFFPYVSLFVFPCAFYMLASLLAKNLLIWIHLKCSTWIIFDPYVLVLKPQLVQLMGNLSMSMLILCVIVYLKKGDSYGII